MSNYPQAVVRNNHIYVGGGFAKSDDIATLQEYDPQHNRWDKSIAEQCPTKYFGMAVVKNQLLIIGGTDTLSKTKRGLVYSLDFKTKKWIRFQRSSMLAYRSSPSVVTYKNRWLIAIGGEDKDGQVLSSVETLDIDIPEDKRYWHYCSALPVKSAHFTSAIVGDMLFTFGTTT
jgi:N-acetylneuraminic acid mutarotase